MKCSSARVFRFVLSGSLNKVLYYGLVCWLCCCCCSRATCLHQALDEELHEGSQPMFLSRWGAAKMLCESAQPESTSKYDLASSSFFFSASCFGALSDASKMRASGCVHAVTCGSRPRPLQRPARLPRLLLFAALSARFTRGGVRCAMRVTAQASTCAAKPDANLGCLRQRNQSGIDLQPMHAAVPPCRCCLLPRAATLRECCIPTCSAPKAKWPWHAMDFLPCE